MLSFIAPSPFTPLIDAMVADVVPSSCMPGLMRLSTEQPTIRDDGESYSLDVTAPGVAPSDLSVEVHDCHLTIKGETRTAHHTHFVDFTVLLPHDADATATSAASDNGLLTVTLLKKAKEETRIPVATEAMDNEKATAVDGFYKVAFGPRIVVRAKPEPNGEILRAVQKDVVVEGTPLAASPNWIALADGSGYIMVKHEKHGVLLEPTAPRPYKITIVAAGLAPADITVTAEGPDLLTATGETVRTDAKLHRRFQLPRDADAAGALATCVNGILTIAVPKKAKAPLSHHLTVLVNAPEKGNDDEMMADATIAGKDDEEGVVV